MRTQEELDILYAKFDKDVATKSRWFRALIALDQLIGVLIWNNSNDETISSKIHRKQVAGTANWFDNTICKMLNKIEGNHCYKSRGE